MAESRNSKPAYLGVAVILMVPVIATGGKIIVLYLTGFMLYVLYSIFCTPGVLISILAIFTRIIAGLFSYTPCKSRKSRKPRTLSEPSILRENNYNAIKLYSDSVAPLDEIDINAFRNTAAYKKVQAANKINAVKQYASC
jgi:hypothetical protein